jgi:Outer membrane protein beta-barrel domain
MKIFSLFLALVLIVLVSKAQVQIGVKAGYNLTTYNYSGSLYANPIFPKSNFNVGLLASCHLNQSFYLQSEIVYSGQGASRNSHGGWVFHFNDNYINVPVLFKYQHKNGLFAVTGPQLGILLHASETTTGSDRNMTAFTGPIDFSWAFGIGFRVPKTRLGIDARYNLGLTTVNKVTTGDLFISNLKNSVFQFGLFYILKN